VKTTVWGIASKVGGIAAHWNNWGDLTGAHSYKSLSLELPGDGVIVDCDHDGVERGKLLYAELGQDEALRCVAVVDSDLTHIDEDIYFSPQLLMVGHGIDERSTYIAREASLLGLSLTFSPAALAAQPIGIRAGDLRSSVDRYRWPCSWQHSDPLLARALDHIGTGLGVEHRHATAIVDRRPRRFPPLEPGTRRRPTVEYRSAQQVDVSAPQRTLDVIVMPWETPTVVHHKGRRVHEICSHGAFDTIDRDGGRVKVNRDHDFTKPLGRAIAFDPQHPEGLWARLRIAKTRDGDEALELAREQVLDVSAGFGVYENGETWPSARVRRLRKCWLDHVAMVSNPAYAGARVLAVRRGTPNLDRVLAGVR
jgi:HK97 family phage prohead protease